MNHKFSRRDFLKGVSVGAGAGLLSACAFPPSVSVATPAVCPTQRFCEAPAAPACPTPTPIPVPPPTPVSTNFDVYAYYLQGINLPEQPEPNRLNFGFATVAPLYGPVQDPVTMRMDIKWARENGVTTFVMPESTSNGGWVTRIADMFLPASEPPFEIDFSILFNPTLEYMPSDELANRVVDVAKNLLSGYVQHPRYKRLPDGRPVVFYFLAGVVAYSLGVDVLEKTVGLLRSNVGEDIFLVGDIMVEPYEMQTDPKFQIADYISRQVKLFDAIDSYYLWHAGYEWHSLQDYNHVVTPFKDMIAGYQEACDVWAEKAHHYGSKFVPPISPAGLSNRLLYEAGIDTGLSDRHEGVSYDTAKEMAKIGAKYADPELKMVIIGAWNECTEGTAILPSKGFKFGPVHAVRDTFAIEPTGGWPEDYYPPS